MEPSEKDPEEMEELEDGTLSSEEYYDGTQARLSEIKQTLLAEADIGAPYELADIKKIFDEYDEVGEGLMGSLELLRKLLPDLGVQYTEQALGKLNQELDQDNNGVIDFGEFVHFFEVLRAALIDRRRLAHEPISDCVTLTTAIREKKKMNDQYLTKQQADARLRIHSLLYDLPCFAPDYVYRRWWDVWVMLAMIYIWIVPTTIVIGDVTPSFAANAVDYLVIVVMICDVLVNLNTAVQLDGAFSLVVKRELILKHYFRHGRMWVDVVSALPIHHIFLYTGPDIVYKIIQCTRMVKLLKFGHLFYLTNRGTMDTAFVQFYFWTVPMLKFVFKMFFIGHILTVTRLLITKSLPDTDCPDYGLDACEKNVFVQYFYAFFWVWSLLTTQGTAALESKWAFVYAAFVMLLSLLLQGHVVANMSAIMLKSNVEAQNQDSMRSTLAIMKHYNIPVALQQEVLSFQFHSLQQNAAASLAHTLERLPPAMQREVGLYVKIDLVTKVPMFRDLSSECRLAVANCLIQDFAEPSDFIIMYGDDGGTMYFMMHGFADVIIPHKPECPDEGGRVVATIIRGDFFGEIALLKPELKRTASIQALTYCDLFRLEYDSVQVLSKAYPAIANRMEKEAYQRGLRPKPNASRKKKGKKAGKEGADEETPEQPAETGTEEGDGEERKDSVPVLGKVLKTVASARLLTGGGQKRFSVQSGHSAGDAAAFVRSVSRQSHHSLAPKPPSPSSRLRSIAAPALSFPVAAPTEMHPAAPFQPMMSSSSNMGPGPPVVSKASIAPRSPLMLPFYQVPNHNGDATPTEPFDVGPSLRRLLLSFAKQVEASQERSQRTLMKELKFYTHRVTDIEQRLAELTERLNDRKRESQHFGRLFDR